MIWMHIYVCCEDEIFSKINVTNEIPGINWNGLWAEMLNANSALAWHHVLATIRHLINCAYMQYGIWGHNKFLLWYCQYHLPNYNCISNSFGSTGFDFQMVQRRFVSTTLAHNQVNNVDGKSLFFLQSQLSTESEIHPAIAIFLVFFLGQRVMVSLFKSFIKLSAHLVSPCLHVCFSFQFF